MKEYIPNPVDTGHIRTPEGVGILVEEMAKNVHEVWSKTRNRTRLDVMEKADDVLKQHRAWFRMKNCLKKKRCMTEILQWKP